MPDKNGLDEDGQHFRRKKKQYYGKRLPAHREIVLLPELKQLTWPDGFSEEEKLIAKRLGWYDYVIQLPEFIEHAAVTKQRLNVDSGKMEYIAVRKEKRKDHETRQPQNYYFGRCHKQVGNEIHVRWAEYCRFYKLPVDWLKNEYPYLYSIIRDAFAVNLVNRRNNEKMKQAMQINFEMATWAVSALYAAYTKFCEVPEMVTHLKKPENKQIVDDIEQILDLLLNPTLDPDKVKRGILVAFKHRSKTAQKETKA